MIRIGLSEQLFERLTASPAEPYLKGLQDLYINYWGKCCFSVNDQYLIFD